MLPLLLLNQNRLHCSALSADKWNWSLFVTQFRFVEPQPQTSTFEYWSMIIVVGHCTIIISITIINWFQCVAVDCDVNRFNFIYCWRTHSHSHNHQSFVVPRYSFAFCCLFSRHLFCSHRYIRLDWGLTNNNRNCRTFFFVPREFIGMAATPLMRKQFACDSNKFPDLRAFRQFRKCKFYMTQDLELHTCSQLARMLMMPSQWHPYDNVYNHNFDIFLCVCVCMTNGTPSTTFVTANGPGTGKAQTTMSNII